METVEIQPDRIKALKYYSPILVFTLALLLYATYIEFASVSECSYLFNLNSSIVALLVACYALPVYLFLCSMWVAVISYKSIRTHYYPPLDTPVFFRTTAKTGYISRLRGVIGVALPLFCIWVIFIGHNAFVETTKGKSAIETFEHIDQFCMQTHNRSFKRD
ncbi:MAG: hypothetical protein WBN96_00715 [Gammaproteobacteria bacterium]